MEAANREFQPVIEAVGAKPVGSGVEVKFRTTLAAREAFHPAHQSFCKALAAMALERNEVVDVKSLAPGQPLRDAKARKRHRLAAVLDIDEAPAGSALLPPGPREQLVGALDVGTEHLRHR